MLDVLAEPGQFSIGKRRGSPVLSRRVGANQVESLEVVDVRGGEHHRSSAPQGGAIAAEAVEAFRKASCDPDVVSRLMSSCCSLV